jgi:hypothetical protein
MDIEVMTGLSPEQLDALTAAVEPRVSMISKGRPFDPPLAPSVLIVVVLLRTNWTQAQAAAVFDTSQPTVSRRFNDLLGPIEEALQTVVPDPADAVHGDTVLIDGTLAPTSDWQHREDLFSGKHMRPGYNLQIACLPDGELIGVGAPVPGCHHDIYCWYQCGLREALGSQDLVADLGYEHVPGMTTGVKRLPGQGLSRTNYERNRGLARIRVPVERCIAHLKTWRILSHPYRGPLDTYPAIVRTVTALHFYLLSGHPLWTYE